MRHRFAPVFSVRLPGACVVLSVTFSYARAEKFQNVRGGVPGTTVPEVTCSVAQHRNSVSTREIPGGIWGSRTLTEAIFNRTLKNFRMALQWKTKARIDSAAENQILLYQSGIPGFASYQHSGNYNNL